MDEKFDGALESVDDDSSVDLSYDVLTLISDDGEEYQFEMLDRVELDGAEYVALMTITEGEGSEDEQDDEIEGELIFMKAVSDGEEDFLESIEDDAEYDRVSECFTDRLSEYFDIE